VNGIKDHKAVRERSAGVSAAGRHVLYAPLPPDTLKAIQSDFKAARLRGCEYLCFEGITRALCKRERERTRER